MNITIQLIDTITPNEDPELEPVITYKPLDVTVDVDKGSILYDVGGITRKLQLKSFAVDIFSKTIVVEYAELIVDGEGNELGAVAKVFDAITQESWDYFYNTITGESNIGMTLMTMCLNGVCIENFGVPLFE